MPIQKGDVKLLKSAVMADVPEGGGAATGQQIEDGVKNAIFPDVSESDRALGRVALRKTFARIETDDVDTYMGANVVVAEPPQDPRVAVTLFAARDAFDVRDHARSRMESYLYKGALWGGILFENHIAGQRVIQLLQRPGSELPNVGQTLCLVQNEGLQTEREQYVRVTKVAAVNRVYSYASGGGYVDYSAQVVTLDLSDALRFDFTGTSANRMFEVASGAARVRDTVVADAGTYVGVVPLVQAAGLGDFTIRGESIYTQLVPGVSGFLCVRLLNPSLNREAAW